MDLNADLGESWYDAQVGNDGLLMPLLDSCNVACGFHGGDATTMRRTIELALENGVAIGAHPSFPDRKNFGRQRMELPVAELTDLIAYQVSALQGMVRLAGAELHHVKPHGALYHYLNETEDAAKAFAETVRGLGVDLIYGPPQGHLSGAAAGAGVGFWSEGFADRRYDVSHRSSSPTLHLRSRQFPDATLETPAEAVDQVRRMIIAREVIAVDGKAYPLAIQTICLHGDHPGAIARARAVRQIIDLLCEV